jgi:hypothetical protein
MVVARDAQRVAEDESRLGVTGAVGEISIDSFARSLDCWR